MNLLTAEKFPAVLALFVTIVGFYVSTVAEQIRSQAAVSYLLTQRPSGVTTLQLKNISREQVVRKAIFQLSCLPLVPDCLAFIDEHPENPKYYVIDRAPPVAPSNARVRSNSMTARLEATLVPGAVVSLSVRLSETALDKGIEVEFYYTPDRNAPEAILLLGARSLTARFVDGYLNVMIAAFFFSGIGLIIMLAFPILGQMINPPHHRDGSGVKSLEISDNGEENK